MKSLRLKKSLKSKIQDTLKKIQNELKI